MATAALTDQQQSYRSEGYALLDGLFPSQVVGLFHARMQHALNLANAAEFHTQSWLVTKPVIEVYSKRYPPMEAFHHGLTPIAAQLAGCDLLPTYAYFRAYQKGDVCVVHSDREACEHSISLTLELADNIPWALCIGKDELSAPAAVEPDFGTEQYSALPMRAGDGVMYRGVAHRHGRVEPNPNRWSAHLFLHWVDANGPHSDHAFDAVAQKLAAARPA